MTEALYSFELTDLQDAERPDSTAGRKPAVNPFADAVKLVHGDRNLSKSLTLPWVTEEKRDAVVKQIGRDLTNAGKAFENIQVRRSVKIDEMAKTLTVTFWVADRIPKSDDAPAEDEATEPAEDAPAETAKGKR